MQGMQFGWAFCKLLCFNALSMRFQKFNFWKVKVQLYVYAPFSVCLYPPLPLPKGGIKSQFRSLSILGWKGSA